MIRTTGRLSFLFGACLPFVAVGPQIATGLRLSPSILIGMAIVAASLLTRGVTVRLILLIALILVFALSAMGRHPPGSYVFSLIMLFVVMAPMCMGALGAAQRVSLQNGFMLGLAVTLTVVWVEILSQILGQQALYQGVANLFRPHAERMGAHNFFVAYQRPYAAFMEPAHLAIYLSVALLALDRIKTDMAGKLRNATVLTLLLVGSVVGYILLAGYLAMTLGGSLRYSVGRISRKTWRRAVFSAAVILTGLCMFIVLQPDTASQMLDLVSRRITRTLAVVQSGQMSGSEGSRANAFRVVLDYWNMEGLRGFLFGTGYGNTSDWLIATYGNIGSFTTVARGQLDSIMVGVILATGMPGLVLYLTFVIACIRRAGRQFFWPLFVMFLLLNFASGFLIAYLIWHLLAVVILLSDRPESAQARPAPASCPGRWQSAPQVRSGGTAAELTEIPYNRSPHGNPFKALER